MLVTILTFIIAISILVLIHEFGHFFVAKKSGVWVQEFGLGYPPRAIGKKIGETIYSLNWIPAGGFVRIFGELKQEGEDKKLQKRAMYNKSWKVRLAVSIAGVFMNFVFGVVVFAIVYSILGVPQYSGKVQITEVAPDSPAQLAGLIEGDYVLFVENDGSKQTIKTTDELIDYSLAYAGQEITYTVARNAEVENKVECPSEISLPEGFQCFEVGLAPRVDPPEGQGAIGVAISDTEIVKPTWWKRPFLGVVEGLREAWFWGRMIVERLFVLFVDLFRGVTPEDIAGPIGIYQVSSTIQRQSGMLMLLHFFGILSVNFAIVNLMPLPALDGGRILFILFEVLTGKRISTKIELTVNQIGMVLLLLLFLLITIGDIRRLIGF
ncbi:MAG: site-2 protease family protein [Ignavibacteria bacterium]|nr:site-2 protease family protein [Ignavibacteria bacterium]